MIHNKLLEESTSLAAGGALGKATSKIEAQKPLQRILSIILRGPAEILKLVREGQTSKASIYCWTGGILAFGVVLVWSLIMAPCMIVGALVMAAASLMDVVNGPVGDVVGVVILLPGLIAAIIIPLISLVGAGLGLLGLIRNAGKRALGALGFVVNILVLAGFLALAVLTIAIGG